MRAAGAKTRVSNVALPDSDSLKVNLPNAPVGESGASAGPRIASAHAAFVRISSRPVPRVIRMMTVARDLGYTPVFLGGRRETGLPDTEVWDGWRVERVGPHFPLLNGKRALRYARGIFSFNAALLRKLWKLRPRVIHVSDAEPFLTSWLVARLTRARILYNIHDNLAQRYRLPRIIGAMLNAVEGLFVVLSDKALVPEQFRRDALPRWCRRKVAVVRNTPIDPGQGPIPSELREPITILLGGWLDYGRGLRGLIDLVEATPGLQLRVAGEGAPEIIEYVTRSPRVTYLGFMTQSQVLEETRACDFIGALYDPAKVINRYAASNKIAEALAVGRPLLINEEIEIARYLAGQGCTVQAPYAGIAQLGTRLKEIASDRAAYAQMCREARRVYDAEYAWSVVRARIEAVFKGEELVT